MLDVLLHVMLHASYHKSSTSRCMFHHMLHVLLHVVLPSSCHVSCPRHEFCFMIHASCFMPHFELHVSCFIPYAVLFRESRFICHEAFVACLKSCFIACFMLYVNTCLLYTSPSPRDVEESRMPSSA